MWGVLAWGVCRKGDGLVDNRHLLKHAGSMPFVCRRYTHCRIAYTHGAASTHRDRPQAEPSGVVATTAAHRCGAVVVRFSAAVGWCPQWKNGAGLAKGARMERSCILQGPRSWPRWDLGPALLRLVVLKPIRTRVCAAASATALWDVAVATHVFRRPSSGAAILLFRKAKSFWFWFWLHVGLAT